MGRAERFEIAMVLLDEGGMARWRCLNRMGTGGIEDWMGSHMGKWLLELLVLTGFYLFSPKNRCLVQ